MSDKSIHFCKECHNLTFLQTTDDKNLIHYCKICESTEEYEGSGCIYSHDFRGLDISEIVNSNKFITHDVTLPSIKGNINIKCQNVECQTNKDSIEKSIKYVKHDNRNMRYTYICETCGQKWANKK